MTQRHKFSEFVPLGRWIQISEVDTDTPLASLTDASRDPFSFFKTSTSSTDPTTTSFSLGDSIKVYAVSGINKEKQKEYGISIGDLVAVELAAIQSFTHEGLTYMMVPGNHVVSVLSQA